MFNLDQRAQATTESMGLTIRVSAAALFLMAGAASGLAQDSFGLADAEPTTPAATSDDGGTPPTSENLINALQDVFSSDDEAEDSGLWDDDTTVVVDEYDLVDLHVNEEDLGAVLQLLSIQSERNIISSDSVTASITADLYGVTFYEALDAILHVNNFGYIERGNFIYVYTREQLEQITEAMRVRESRVIHLNYLNAVDAAQFATTLLSENGGTITTSVATDSFATMGETPVGADTYANDALLVVHDYTENVDAIVALIAELDTRPVQVLVEATILQTTLTEANAFGVDFAILANMDFADFVGIGGPLTAVKGLIDGQGATLDGAKVPASTRSSSGSVVSGAGNVRDGKATLKAGIVSDDVAVFLRVLDEVTDLTVVSSPKLMTLNRQAARVLVGTKVGYLNTTTTQTATTQTVEFLDVGTQLAVRPFVAENGVIRLELQPQVSSYNLREVSDNSGATVTIPDEDTTELTTNVMLNDGQTVVLGGLFTESTSSSRRQVPLLGDIPFIGAAFRGHDDSTRRSEIIFMVTPSIVNNAMLNASGESATRHVAAARVGARNGLMLSSRERRVGALLIEASGMAEAGETAEALLKITKALRLQPNSPAAIELRNQINGEDPRYFDRGLLSHILAEAVMEIDDDSGYAEEMSEFDDEFMGSAEDGTEIDAIFLDDEAMDTGAQAFESGEFDITGAATGQDEEFWAETTEQAANFDAEAWNDDAWSDEYDSGSQGFDPMAAEIEAEVSDASDSSSFTSEGWDGEGWDGEAWDDSDWDGGEWATQKFSDQPETVVEEQGFVNTDAGMVDAEAGFVDRDVVMEMITAEPGAVEATDAVFTAPEGQSVSFASAPSGFLLVPLPFGGVIQIEWPIPYETSMFAAGTEAVAEVDVEFADDASFDDDNQ